MPLLSLSNELLLEIASYFKYGSDINALMQTTGRLYYLLNTYLYRHNIRYFESSALEWAICNGVVTVVERMLDEGVPLNHGIPYSGLVYSQLDLAVHHGHENVVKLLLERGADPDPTRWVYSTNKSRRKTKRKYAHDKEETSLHHALTCSSASMVRLLVSHVKKLRGEKAMAGRQQQGSWDEVPRGFEGLRVPRGLPIATLMMNACRKGDPTVAEFLAKNMPKAPNEMEHRYRRYMPLVEAVKRNHLEVIRVLLNAGYDPNHYDESTDGAVPLHFAIQEDNVEAVRLLLDNGARSDFAYRVYNDNSLELLNQAARCGNVAIAKLLLQHIDIENKIASGHEERDTIITTAATFGLMEIFQMILKNNEASQGGKFALHNKYLRPPLSLAAEKGHRDIVALLLDHGSDVHDGGMSTESYTPLLMAVSNGHTEIVQLLLDRGVNFSLEGLYGSYEACPRDRVSLGTAALCYSTKFPVIFQLVLDAVDTISNPGESYILMVEVIISGNVELLQLLVNRGLQLDLGERHNINLVKYAAKGGPDMLWALSSCGVIVLSPEDIDAQYSLCMAVYEGNSAVVDYFLGQGFDPNYIPSVFAGHSYMEIAARGNSKTAAATLDVLLYHGANFDDMPGACTYDCECVRDDEQQLRAARLLLERGANPSPTSTWGQNTLGIALFKSHRKTIRLMLREICNRGIFYDNLDNVLRWIEKHVDDGKRDWQFWRAIENFYWRQVYPVPDTAMAGVSDAMASLVV